MTNPALCGPPDPTKNLGTHLDRDTQVQQDRVMSGGQSRSQQGFRSPQVPTAAPQEFNSFVAPSTPRRPFAVSDAMQQSDPFIEHPAPTGPAGPAHQSFGPSTSHGPVPAYHQSFGPTYVHPDNRAFEAQYPSGSSWRGGRAGTEDNWADQFSSMSLNQEREQGGFDRTAAETQEERMRRNPMLRPYPFQAGHGGYSTYGPGYAGYGGPAGMYGGPAYQMVPPVSHGYGLGMGPGMQDSMRPEYQPLGAVDISIVKKIYEEDFDQHMTQWMQNEGANNTEFTQQMDEWMKTHGPDDQTIHGGDTPTNNRTPTPATVASKPGVSEEAEQARPAQQGDSSDLAQVAGEILDSVSDNRSEKFMNSEFLGLMRAVSSGQTVLDGDVFVENTSRIPTQASRGLSGSAPAFTQNRGAYNGEGSGSNSISASDDSAGGGTNTGKAPATSSSRDDKGKAPASGNSH